MKNTRTIRQYFSLRFGLVAVTPVLIIIILVWLYMMPNLNNRLETQRLEQAEAIADRLSILISGGERQLNVLAEYLDTRLDLTSMNVRDLLSYQCGNGTFFKSIIMTSVFNDDDFTVGFPLLSNDFSPPLYPQKENADQILTYLDQIQANGGKASAESPLTLESVIVLSFKKTNVTVFGEVGLRELSTFLYDPQVKTRYDTYIVDHRDDRIILPPWRNTKNSTRIQYKKTTDSGNNSVTFTHQGTAMVGNMITTQNGIFSIIAAQPQTQASLAARTTFLTLTISLFSAMILALIVSWVMADRITSLIRSFVEQANSISHGIYQLNWPQTRIAEFIRLGQSLRYMSNVIHQREKAIVESETRLEITLNSIGDAVIATNRDSIVTRVNPIAEKLTGWTSDEAVGKPLEEIYKIINAYSRERVPSPAETVLKSGEIIRLDDHTILCSKNGEEYHISDSGAPIKETDGRTIGVVLVFRDITNETRMEEIMIQSEKMLSVGGLAAGIAHEINNPLASMMQTAANMENRLSKSSSITANQKAVETAGTNMEAIDHYMRLRDIPRMLQTIRMSGKRVADIVNNMLTFASKSELKTSSHDLGVLMDTTLELAETDYDLKKNFDFKSIRIRRHYDDDLPVVPCEKGKIQQVLLNILSNGAQAMQMNGTENPTFIIRTNHLKEKKMVSLEIEDNGPGMDDAVRKRVFEPFFTTKPVGVGTGLGLSVSYFIVTENHKGEMEVQSSPDNGSKFIIRLPLENKTTVFPSITATRK